MTTGGMRHTEREELEMLLPWYVTGRLDAADRARVEAWLGHEGDAARLIGLVREEQQAADELSASIAVPSTLTVERTAAYVARAGGSAGSAAAVSLWSSLRNLFTLPTPGAVRLAGAAMALVVVLQAIAISALWRQPTAPYETASGEAPSKLTVGTFALVKFNGAVTAEAMSKALGSLGIAVVDGPKPGGLYRVRIAPTGLNDAEVENLIQKLRRETSLFVLVTPAP
jgi:hypothetical protein